MGWIHDSSIGEHVGILGTYQKTKKIFYWPKLKEDVISHVMTCDVCQLNKSKNKLPPGLLEPIPIPPGAWQLITMDFISGLPKSENKDVIMVVIDKFIKYAHFIVLSHPITTIEVARVFLENVYQLHGLLVKIITDRDSIFTSLFWKELFKKLEISINLSTAYHPQTDGQSERLNQCLEQYLKCMTSQKPKTVDQVAILS
jgi:Integrase zinc binding domain